MSWLSADPEHVFWMRVLLAVAEGVWIPLTGVAGFFLFRWRERARLEEQGTAELRKLQIGALVRHVAAVAKYAEASQSARHAKLQYEADPGPALKALYMQDLQHLDAALAELTAIMTSEARLLPSAARAALDPSGGNLAAKLVNAQTSQEQTAAMIAIAKLLDDYLPDLPVIRRRKRRSWWRKWRRPGGAAGGAARRSSPDSTSP